MPTLINDPPLEEQLIADRQARGIDHHDEVWDGVYVMAPIANNEHQAIVSGLTTVICILIDHQGLGLTLAGANVSDQPRDWTKNYRVPDVLAFLNGNESEDRQSHWYCRPGLRGPDFVVEIVSVHDRSREKLDFYSRIGVRELLLIDRDPWQLELFRLTNGQLESAGVATETNGMLLPSEVVPIRLQLSAGLKRPTLLIESDAGQIWKI